MAGERTMAPWGVPIHLPVRLLGLLGLVAVGLWIYSWLPVTTHSLVGSGVAVSFEHDPLWSWRVAVEMRAAWWPISWHVMYQDFRTAWRDPVVLGTLVLVNLPFAMLAVTATGLLLGRSLRWVGLLAGATGYWVPTACEVAARWEGLGVFTAAGSLWVETAAIFLAAAVVVLVAVWALSLLRKGLWTIRPRYRVLAFMVPAVVVWWLLRPDEGVGFGLGVLVLLGAVAVPLLIGLGPPHRITLALVGGWLTVPVLGLVCDAFGLVLLLFGAQVRDMPSGVWSVWSVWPVVLGLAIGLAVVASLVWLVRRDRALLAVEGGERSD